LLGAAIVLQSKVQRTWDGRRQQFAAIIHSAGLCEMFESYGPRRCTLRSAGIFSRSAMNCRPTGSPGCSSLERIARLDRAIQYSPSAFTGFARSSLVEPGDDGEVCVDLSEKRFGGRACAASRRHSLAATPAR
jgi:hypothetical protein